MNELILNLNIFDTLESALSHGLNSLLETDGVKGWRTTGKKVGALGTIVAARTGSGFLFSYLVSGSELTIYYFESDVLEINSITLNSKAADPANT